MEKRTVQCLAGQLSTASIIQESKEAQTVILVQSIVASRRRVTAARSKLEQPDILALARMRSKAKEGKAGRQHSSTQGHTTDTDSGWEV
eukprot:1160093-Pelagomonas_calceolata.AAC.1